MNYDRRVLIAVPAWDYGDHARGTSWEAQIWLPAMEGLVREVELFPMDLAIAVEHSLDDRLVEAVERVRPDLVLFHPFRDDVAPDVLLKLRELTTTAAFFADDQWRFDDFSSRYATAYDYVITTDPTVVPRYRALGGRPILTQYAGVVHVGAAGPVESDAELVYDVSFVGGAHPWRKWLVDWLGRRGIDVVCFGEGWPNGRIGYEEMDEVFRTSRINLNISNSRQLDTRYLLADYANFAASREGPKTSEQIKARHFEIPIAGGCQLSYYVPGIEDFLTIGQELMIYATPEDCIDQVQRLLTDPDRRLAIARQSWTRCVSEHTYEQRCRKWLTAIWPTG